MKFENHTRFPFKRCIIASIVILLCYLMVLILPYSIIYTSVHDKNNLPKYSFIILICWISLTIASIIAYWIYQLIKYLKIRKDEK